MFITGFGRQIIVEAQSSYDERNDDNKVTLSEDVKPVLKRRPLNGASDLETPQGRSAHRFYTPFRRIYCRIS